MIDLPIHNPDGEQVDTLQVDEAPLGGEVRPILLKQAFVRYHADRRLGTVRTKSRAEVAYSSRKLYKQKGTGNARRGDRGTNILRGGGHGFAKRPRDFRQDMPKKMRRLANRNALLCKILDGELKIVDSLDSIRSADKPSAKNFSNLLGTLGVDRSCLVALGDVRTHDAASARNVDGVTVTQIDRLNVYDLLNHRYVLAERAAFEAYLSKIVEQSKNVKKTQRLAREAAQPQAEPASAGVSASGGSTSGVSASADMSSTPEEQA